jgi:SP family arabinose:H+ symporter-like MFS transporter
MKDLLCSWAFYMEAFGILPLCVFTFIAAHAIAQGAAEL